MPPTRSERLLTSLRSGPTPGFSADLQSMLLAMAQPAPATAASPAVGLTDDAVAPASSGWLRGRSRPNGVPPIPRAPESVRQLRVPTVAPAAPALHRSPRRAAAIAGLAAGASAAAAIGLAVVGPGPGWLRLAPCARPSHRGQRDRHRRAGLLHGVRPVLVSTATGARAPGTVR